MRKVRWFRSRLAASSGWPCVWRRAGQAAIACVLVACAGVRSAPRTAPAAPTAAPEAPPALPPVPHVVGRLNVRVVYPPEGQLIASRDSNFIFGSVGSGDATLTIDGVAVPVLPNGAFLAFLRVPTREASAYEIVARQGSDTARVLHRVTLPAARTLLSDDGPLVVDSSSLTPRGVQAWPAAEAVRVQVRAPRNARVALRTSGADLPLTNTAAALRAVPNADSARVGGDPYLWAADVPARELAAPTTVVVRRGADSVALSVGRVLLADSAGPRYAAAGAAPSQLPDTDRVVIVRPVPNGTYKWFLLPGTVVQTTARAGSFARVRLDDSLEGWVDSAELAPLPAGYAPVRRVAGNARVVPGGLGGGAREWSDVVIPMAERPPYAVETSADGLVLTLYGVVANTDIVNYAAGDSLVRRVVWEQVNADRARYTITLSRPAFGYLARYERGAFVLRVRRPPAIDAARPLAGVTVAVDAGHPPAGSTGPTGLYEAVATLAIASRLQTYLEQRGATVVMTRTAPGAVALGERPVIARRANAHAFVSIHLNALPDGINPARAHGTGTYYFNAPSEPLAREVQRAMVRRMGLRDLGIYYDNLAVLRPTWMPAVLCEGAFVIIPEQEAALRTPEFQDRYALGVAEGIEAYFGALGGGRPSP